jgi:hypothetical protein
MELEGVYSGGLVYKSEDVRGSAFEEGNSERQAETEVNVGTIGHRVVPSTNAHSYSGGPNEGNFVN